MRYAMFILAIVLAMVGCTNGYKRIDGKWAYVTPGSRERLVRVP